MVTSRHAVQPVVVQLPACRLGGRAILGAMPLSLQYRLARERPLDGAELAQVDDLLSRSGARTGWGLVADVPPDEGARLSGSAQAPRDENEFVAALNDWLSALSAMASVIGGTWRVEIGGVEIPWDPAAGRFDLEAARPG